MTERQFNTMVNKEVMASIKEKILSVDYGTRRIGLAVSDPLGITAQPVGVIKREGKKKILGRIKELIEKQDIKKILIGLPLNMDGSEGTLIDEIKKFGGYLEKNTGLPVVYYDERLSTVQAERLLIGADVSRQKRRDVIDKLAAQIILQSYLDSQKG